MSFVNGKARCHEIHRLDPQEPAIFSHQSEPEALNFLWPTVRDSLEDYHFRKLKFWGPKKKVNQPQHQLDDFFAETHLLQPHRCLIIFAGVFFGRKKSDAGRGNVFVSKPRRKQDITRQINEGFKDFTTDLNWITSFPPSTRTLSNIKKTFEQWWIWLLGRGFHFG